MKTIDNKCSQNHYKLFFVAFNLLALIVNLASVIACIAYFQVSFVIPADDPVKSSFIFQVTLFVIEVVFALISIISLYHFPSSSSPSWLKRVILIVSCLLLWLSIVSTMVHTSQLMKSQGFYQEEFFIKIKEFDETRTENLWMNTTQLNYQCCGYSEPRDYKEFFKPSSCCDETRNSNEDFEKCRFPTIDKEGNLGEPKSYYDLGCSVPINRIMSNFHTIFIVIATLGIAGFFLAICILLQLIDVHKKYNQIKHESEKNALEKSLNDSYSNNKISKH